MRAVRGGRIGLIFQEPMTALSVHYTVGNQIIEAIRAHGDLSKAAARERVDRAAARGRHSPPGDAHRRLSVPAQRRPAPARRHRARARRRPGNPDRRRADHRARRHHPGADPGAAAPPAAHQGRRADADHPRHGRDRADGRRCRRDVSRPHRRVRAGGATVRGAATSLYARAAALGARICARRRASGWRRSAARCRIRARVRSVARFIRAVRK